MKKPVESRSLPKAAKIILLIGGPLLVGIIANAVQKGDFIALFIVFLTVSVILVGAFQILSKPQ